MEKRYLTVIMHHPTRPQQCNNKINKQNFSLKTVNITVIWGQASCSAKEGTPGEAPLGTLTVSIIAAKDTHLIMQRKALPLRHYHA